MGNTVRWDSGQYLKFESERSRPAVDLAGRIPVTGPKRVIDIGCGPGNSTAVLRALYPDAEILGVDNSEAMIEKARGLYHDITFRLFDIQDDPVSLGKYDVVFSNACLQWVPNHPALLGKLFRMLEPGGALAVQIPKNWDSPLYRAMDEVVSEPKWGFDKLEVAYNGSLSPEEYFDILSSLTPAFTMWETIYYHRMASHRALVEWVQGTKLRPYTNLLSEEKSRQLQDEIVEKIKGLYDVQKNGEVIYKFRRLFFIAERK